MSTTDLEADMAYIRDMLSQHFTCMNAPEDGPCTGMEEIADYLGVEWKDKEPPTTITAPEGVTFDT